MGRTIKTGRQCRDKYVNSLKTNGTSPIDKSWSEEDNQKLFELYMMHGSAWVNYLTAFPNK